MKVFLLCLAVTVLLGALWPWSGVSAASGADGRVDESRYMRLLERQVKAEESQAASLKQIKRQLERCVR